MKESALGSALEPRLAGKRRAPGNGFPRRKGHWTSPREKAILTIGHELEQARARAASELTLDC